MARESYWKKLPAESKPSSDDARIPFFALVGDEDKDARDPSKVLPGGFRAPRGLHSAGRAPAAPALGVPAKQPPPPNKARPCSECGWMTYPKPVRLEGTTTPLMRWTTPEVCGGCGAAPADKPSTQETGCHDV